MDLFSEFQQSPSSEGERQFEEFLQEGEVGGEARFSAEGCAGWLPGAQQGELKVH